MIFDSPQIAKIRKRFIGHPDDNFPEILLFDRSEGFAGERIHIERLFSTLPVEIRKEWLGNFLDKDRINHRAAWFEIMLYGWLRSYFQVEFQPKLVDSKPDMVLTVDETVIAVEANAHLYSPEEHKNKSITRLVIDILESIPGRYLVELKILQFGSKLNQRRFRNNVISWLSSGLGTPLEFCDKDGNVFRIWIVNESAERESLSVVYCTGYHIDHSGLKEPLRRKSLQHSSLRDLDFPYIIALFLEPCSLSAEEVVSAWLGPTRITVDPDINQVISREFDQTGISYLGTRILHTSVSGILVFKSTYDEIIQSHYLTGKYVENPYAKVPIDPNIFQFCERFLVIGKDNIGFEMAWQ